MPRCKNIDHDLKIIFLHPNRCGGKSIEKIIFGREPKNGSADHSCPWHFVKKFGKDTWDTYYKFGFTRNPWDRVASLYFYRKNNLRDFPFDNLYEYLKRGKEKFPLDFISQTKYFYYGNEPINFIGKVETYNNDYIREIQPKLKITKKLPQLNRSKERTNYKDLFCRETKKLLNKNFLTIFRILIMSFKL